MKSIRLFRPRPALCAALAAGALFAVPSVAMAGAPITVARTPAPPSALVNDGTQHLTYNYSIDFTTTPERARTEIVDSNGNVVPGSIQDSSISGAHAPLNSPPETYNVPNGLAPGNYLVRVAYYSQQFCSNPGCPSPADDNNYESEAQADFHVTQATGTIIIQKFEDTNGDGIRQGTEPGVPNWVFQVTAPNPNFIGTTTYTETTAGDGTITLTNVPAGAAAQYTISELLPNPNPFSWTPITSPSQSLTLSTGQTATLQFGNARLTSLCGTVYADQNRVGSFQGGQPGVSGVQVALGGTTGLGTVVAAQQTTNAQGGYCFNNLYPGTYSVKETSIPSPYVAEADVDGNANGANYIDPIALTSGTPSDNNNFLLVTPLPKPPPPPPPPPKPVPAKLCLTKSVNHKHVHQGATVKWKLVVRNCGTVTADQVAVTDPLMADITLSSAGGGALVRGQLVWAVGTLKVGQSKTYYFVSRFDTNAALGGHTNHASADAANAPSVDAAAKTVIVAIHHRAIPVPVTG